MTGSTVSFAFVAGTVATVNPCGDQRAAVERMRRQKLTNLVVTRSDGVLIGLTRRDDAEQALASMEA